VVVSSPEVEVLVSPFVVALVESPEVLVVEELVDSPEVEVLVAVALVESPVLDVAVDSSLVVLVVLLVVDSSPEVVVLVPVELVVVGSGSSGGGQAHSTRQVRPRAIVSFDLEVIGRAVSAGAPGLASGVGGGILILPGPTDRRGDGHASR